MSKSRHVFDYQHSLSYSGKKRVRVYENDDDETLKAKGKPTAAEIVNLRATDVQAYLLGSLEKISEFEQKIASQGRTKLINGLLAHAPNKEQSTASLVSLMSNPENVDNFINATPAQLSLLTPHIEFYLEASSAQVGSGFTKKILFSDFTRGDRTRGIGEVRNFDDASFGAGYGIGVLKEPGSDVGIKEFSWTFDNKHDGDKTIKASVNLYFANALELVNPKSNSDEADFINFIFTNRSEPRDKKSKEPAEMLQEIRQRCNYMATNNDVSNYEHERAASDAKDFTQLKAVVGWSLLPDQIRDFPGTEAEFLSFREGVKKSQRLITLQFTKYTLDFGEQGQVNLTVEYVGSLDSAMSDPIASNIFHASDPKYNEPTIVPIAPTYEDGIFTWLHGSTVGTDPLDQRAFGVTRSDQGMLATKTDTAARARHAAEQGLLRNAQFLQGEGNVQGIRGFTKGALYKALRQGANNNTLVPELQDKPGFKYTVPAADYEQKTLEMILEFYKKTDPNPANDRRQHYVDMATIGLQAVKQAKTLVLSKVATGMWQNLVQQLYSTNLRVLDVRTKAVEAADPANAAAVAQSVATEPRLLDPTGANQDAANVRADRRRRFSRATTAQRQKDIGQVPDDSELNGLDPKEARRVSGTAAGKLSCTYFTVGDLVSLVLRGLMGQTGRGSENLISSRFPCNVMLGAIDLYDMGLTKKPGLAPVSIADIPISTEWFGQWVVENYTRGNPPQRRVSLRDFLNRFFNSLVAPLINKSFSTEDEKVKVVFDMSTVIYPENFDATSPVNLEMLTGQGAFNAGTAPKGIGRVSTKLIQEAAKMGSDSDFLADPRGMPSRTFLVIYATNKDRRKLRGNEEEDRKRGIFHFQLGSDRGLVKRYVFKEKKMPHLKAMHIENSNKSGALIMPLDLELTMVGNAFFRNGSIIYVSADHIAPGLQGKLHLGGYYMIVKSQNTINASTYETRLTCMYLQGSEG